MLAVVLIAAFLAIVALFEDEGSGAQSDHAARLVPAEALVYMHANVDRDSKQFERAAELFRTLPALARLRDRLTRQLTPGGGSIDLEREIDPWLGDEAALALLPGAARAARSLILLDVSDRELAQDFLSRAVGRVRDVSHRGTAIRVYGELAAALLGRFLAIGQLEIVRDAIDARAGRAPSLARDSSFRRTSRPLVRRDPLAYAYSTRAGLRGVLAPRRDLLGRLAGLADEPALASTAASVRAEESLVRVNFLSRLRPTAGAHAPAPPRSARFVPRLLDAAPRAALAYLGMASADRVLAVADTLGGRELPLARELDRLRAHLARDSFDLSGALRPLLGKEAALVVTASASTPILTLLVNGVEERDSRLVLDRLQPLFSRPLGGTGEAGQVPTLQARRIAGVNAATLRLTPTLQLTYAVFDGRAVISTSPRGIADARNVKDTVDENPVVKKVLKGLGPITSVLFLDLERLLALAGQGGLGETSAGLESSFARVNAIGAVTSSGKTARTAEILIEVP